MNKITVHVSDDADVREVAEAVSKLAGVGALSFQHMDVADDDREQLDRLARLGEDRQV